MDTKSVSLPSCQYTPKKHMHEVHNVHIQHFEV